MDKVLNTFNLLFQHKESIIFESIITDNAFYLLENFVYLEIICLSLDIPMSISFINSITDIKNELISKTLETKYKDMDIKQRTINILKKIVHQIYENTRESLNKYNNLIQNIKNDILNIISKKNGEQKSDNLFDQPMKIKDLFNRINFDQSVSTEKYTKFGTYQIYEKNNSIGFLITNYRNNDIHFSCTYYKDDDQNDKFIIFFHRDNLQTYYPNKYSQNLVYCLPSAYNLTSYGIKKVETNILKFIDDKKNLDEIIKFTYLNFKNLQILPFFKTHGVQAIEKELAINYLLKTLKPYEEGVILSSEIDDQINKYFLKTFQKDMKIIKSCYEKIINNETIEEFPVDILKQLLPMLFKCESVYKVKYEKKFIFKGLGRGYSYTFSPLFGSQLTIITEYNLQEDGLMQIPYEEEKVSVEKIKINQTLESINNKLSNQLLSHMFENHKNNFDLIEQKGHFIFAVRKNTVFSDANEDHFYLVVRVE